MKSQFESPSVRTKKVEIIFNQFDLNQDGRLNREEMAALVVAVNPRVKFAPDQISAILDEVFKTYGKFIEADKGLTLEGLMCTYDDGAGDVDRDFEALGLTFPGSFGAEETSIDAEDKAASAKSDFGGYKFEITRDIMELLKGVLARHEKDISADHPSTERISVVEKEIADLRLKLETESEASHEAHMAMGRLLLDRNLAHEARRSFDCAISSDDTDARSYFLCGNACYALKKYSDAKSKFEQGLELGKSDPQAHATLMPQVHVNLGIVLEEEGLLLNACEHYNEAAIINPDHHRALKLLGSAMFALGEFRSARDALQSALYLRPTFPDAQCDLGATLHAMGDEVGARITYEKALQLQPDHINALYNLAGLLRDTGQFEQAVEKYLKVLELDPKSWQAQLNLSLSYLGAKNVQAAKEGLQKTLQMTNRVELYDALAQLKHRSKKNRKLNSVLSRIQQNNESQDSPEELQISADNFVVVESSKFNCVDSCTPPAILALALDIRAFQKVSRLPLLDVGRLVKELQEGKVPENPKIRHLRKATLELILREFLHSLPPDSFQEAIKALNERVMNRIDTNNTIELGKFFAIIAPLSKGTLEERKRAAFEGLLWRRSLNSKNLPIQYAEEYIQLLHHVYPVGEAQGAFSMGSKESLQFEEFAELIDKVFPVLGAIQKLELFDKVRHYKVYCGVCSNAIVGLRYRDSKAKLQLCSNCYSHRKVPNHHIRDSYTFKEYVSHDNFRDRFRIAG